MRAVNETERLVMYFRPSCKRWSCPVCAVAQARRWRHIICYGADYYERCGYPLTFLTFTSHERMRGRDASIKLFRSAFPSIRKKLTHVLGTLEYFAIPETHKDGTVHLHLLIVGWISDRQAKDIGRQRGLGYEAKSEVIVNLDTVGRYVTKYMAKDIAFGDYPPGFRRIRHSVGWPTPELRAVSDDWRFEIEKPDGKTRRRMALSAEDGYTVLDSDHADVWAIVESIG